MDIVDQLENMNFESDGLKQLIDAFLKIARIKKQSINEVSKEFINDIHQNVPVIKGKKKIYGKVTKLD